MIESANYDCILQMLHEERGAKTTSATDVAKPSRNDTHVHISKHPDCKARVSYCTIILMMYFNYMIDSQNHFLSKMIHNIEYQFGPN